VKENEKAAGARRRGTRRRDRWLEWVESGGMMMPSSFRTATTISI